MERGEIRPASAVSQPQIEGAPTINKEVYKKDLQGVEDQASSTKGKIESMKSKVIDKPVKPVIPNVEFNTEPVAAPKRRGRPAKLAEAPQIIHQTPDFGSPVSWREQLQALKESQERIKRQDKEQEYAHISINSRAPIGIVLTSDWHMGSKGTDYQTWERHMEMIKKEPNAFMVPLSNTIDNFIFVSGMFEQMIHPAQQAEMVKDFAKEYKDKILAVVGSRCHEGWTKQTADVEINKLIFQENINAGVPWMPNGGVLDIDLNGISYKFGLQHKARGSSLNAIKNLHDNQMPVDIVAVAHHHTKEVYHANKYQGDFTKQVAFIRTGAYKIHDAYGEGEGFGQGTIGSPIVILMPDRKHFLPFYNLEDGMEYLKVMREYTALMEE